MPNKRPKTLAQQLRNFAGVAYERDLANALRALKDEFSRWENSEIDAFELNDKIHKHHNGISRELYVRYNNADTSFCVASALVRGVLSREEVGEEVFLALEGSVRGLSETWGEEPEG